MKVLLIGLITLTSLSAFADICGKVAEIKVTSAHGAFDTEETAYVGIHNTETKTITISKIQGSSVINLLVSAKIAKADVCISNEFGSSGFQTAILK